MTIFLDHTKEDETMDPMKDQCNTDEMRRLLDDRGIESNNSEDGASALACLLDHSDARVAKE